MKKTTNRELPILFKPEMHRAIREGRKTETRRLDKRLIGAEDVWAGEKDGIWSVHRFGDPCSAIARPRYQVGDRLWVKETWRIWECPSFSGYGEALDPGIVTGSLNGYPKEWLQSRPREFRLDSLDEGPWRSPLHMPKWAARTWLEVTGVRAERLQEITEEGAKAEGVHVGQRARLPDVPPHVTPCLICGQPYRSHVGQVACCFGRCGDVYCDCSYRGGYAWLWDQINGKGSWEANPWVWVYQFKLLEAR